MTTFFVKAIITLTRMFVNRELLIIAINIQMYLNLYNIQTGAGYG